LREGLEDSVAECWIDTVAGVGDFDLDRRPGGRLSANDDATVGGVCRMAFWIRLNSTRCSCSGLPSAGVR
jgi:hypothetical protein